MRTFAVIEHTADLDFRTCYSYGPNYYRTLDGLQYLFAGRCSYIAYQDNEKTVTVTLDNCHRYTTCRKVGHFRNPHVILQLLDDAVVV